MELRVGHDEIWELLGAYALDACDEEERAAVSAHLDVCQECAAEAVRLQRAAGWLGALEVRPPPVRLRAAVLAGAAERRPFRPAPPPGTAGPTNEIRRSTESTHPGVLYREQIEGLDGVLRSLERDQWAAVASEADGWSVQDLIAHLTATESLVAERLDLRSTAWANDPGDVFGRTAAFQRRNRDRTPSATRMDWWDQVSAVERHVAALSARELDRRIEWLGLSIPIRRVVTARAFETWIHADDIRVAVGRVRVAPKPASMHLVADLAVRSLPAALRITGADRPGRTARVVLTGPGGGTWTLALGGEPADPPDAVLTADVIEFCFLAGGRLEPDALDHQGEGDLALVRDLVRAASAFAGP
jgi:uncharacterized protein (TIGR03084 family)